MELGCGSFVEMEWALPVILVPMILLLMKLVRMIFLLLFTIIHANLINPMIILCLFQLLICMMMRKFAYKIYMIML